ncbi:MAG: electron transfer flavoprotein subunit beta/FixA family protein [Candidatus Thalassarchaeaceae archaeon]|jgi:electron transfer flavoprotein beta subunit|nr:electron transfer flavoprotein subunit beta/FixA family protein [Candidatus Thalassarchaeaceae archaeon]
MADIAVLLKQVPDTNAKIVLNDGRVDESVIKKWSMSPYDEYALEAALSLGGSITAITCGPDRSKKMLTDAAAVGASELLHISVDDLSTLDSIRLSNILAAAVKKTGASVVFCGKQAADTNAGSTGPNVANLLGSSCVTMVSELSGDSSEFVALRPSPDGMEKVSISSPCVISFDKTSNELRRPNVKGIMMAKKKAIESISPDDLGVSTAMELHMATHHFCGLNAPEEKSAGQMFEGAECVSDVVSKLRSEAKVI